MLTMALAFLLGLCVDMFYNTMGVHASACVVIGFARGRILELLAPRDGYDMKDRPTVSSLGLVWFLQYGLFMVLIHHLWFFFVEALTFQHFFNTLSKSLLTVLLTFTVLILGQFLFYRHERSTI